MELVKTNVWFGTITALKGIETVDYKHSWFCLRRVPRRTVLRRAWQSSTMVTVASILAAGRETSAMETGHMAAGSTRRYNPNNPHIAPI